MGRVRSWLIAVLLIAALAGLVASLRAAPAPTPAIELASLSPALSLDAPTTVTAGRSFDIDILTDAGVVGPVHLAVISAVGTRQVVGELSDGTATLTVPSELVTGSGVLRLLATTASASGAAEVTVTPDITVDGIVPLAGPRSMIADGAHWTMVTVLASDALGNGLSDGTPVVVHVRRPDGSIELIDGAVNDLLEGLRVPSGTLAGLTTIRVDVDGATGPEVQVAEVPGRPVPFTVDVDQAALRADGRALATVSTGVLADRFGNVLLDGTSATITADGPDGRVRAVSATIDGRATFHLQATNSPGIVTVEVTVADVTSEQLQLEFVAEVTELDVQAARAGERVVITIGPVLTELGGFAPDGTKVIVTLPDGSQTLGQLRDGFASFDVSVTAGARLGIDVLGAHRDVVAP